jgi:hypothetical protein
MTIRRDTVRALWGVDPIEKGPALGVAYRQR